VRKARAGQVTGGRAFGYDNVDVMTVAPDGQPHRSHVERRVNEVEAKGRAPDLPALRRWLRHEAHRVRVER
jgi:hypothetical protein